MARLVFNSSSWAMEHARSCTRALFTRRRSGWPALRRRSAKLFHLRLRFGFSHVGQDAGKVLGDVKHLSPPHHADSSRVVNGVEHVFAVARGAHEAFMRGSNAGIEAD